nr:uncharacterized protein LOC131131811 isoform X2 [Doryrhamphus excisus]
MVGLLYSGEVQVNERDAKDVMAAVHKFGMTPLVERRGTRKEVEPREIEMRDAQVQARVRDAVENRSPVSTEAQWENQPLTPERVTVPPQSILPDLHQSITHPTSNTNISHDASTDSGRVPTRGGQDTGGENMPEDENANSAPRRSANIAKKNLAKMEQLHKKQISVKVTLRRNKSKTKGHTWEVVSMQEDEQTMSFASLSQEDSNLQQKEVADIQPASSTAHPPPKSATPPSRPDATPNPSHRSHRTPPHQPEQLDCDGPAGEYEEQLEKMLEDIMKGLNILPNVGVPEGEAGHRKMLADVPAPQCPSERNLGIESEQPSAHRAQDQLDRERVPGYDPGGLVVRQQGLTGDLSAEESVGQTDGSVHIEACHSRLIPHRSSADSALVPGSDEGVQNRHYSSFQDKHPPQNPRFLSALASNPNDNQPWSLLSLPCVDDLRLPRCLSPIDPFTSLAVDQPVTDIKQQLSWLTNPWLTEQSGLLHFPFADGEHKRPPRWNPRPMRCLDHQQSRPWSRPPPNRVCQTVAERKSYPTRMKRTAVRKQGVGKDGPASPKKRRVHTDDDVADAAGSVHYGIKLEQGMRFCSVSLAQNNILAKERNMSSQGVQSRSVGLPNASQARVRTRRAARRTRTPEPQESTSDGKPTARRRAKVPPLKRKRGWAPKTPTVPLVISKGQTKEPNHSIKMEPDNGTGKPKCQSTSQTAAAVMPVPSEKSTAAETTPDNHNHQQGNSQGSSPGDGEERPHPNDQDPAATRSAEIPVCKQDDEEMEVDVLRCSPDKVPLVRQRENSNPLHHTDVTSEEEDEIDVIG